MKKLIEKLDRKFHEALVGSEAVFAMMFIGFCLTTVGYLGLFELNLKTIWLKIIVAGFSIMCLGVGIYIIGGTILILLGFDFPKKHK